MSIYPATISKIEREQIQSCVENPDFYVECLVKMGGKRGLMLSLYYDAISARRIKPLEVQPLEIKTHFWTEAKREAAGWLMLHPLKDLARILFYLDYLLSTQSI